MPQRERREAGDVMVDGSFSYSLCSTITKNEKDTGRNSSRVRYHDGSIMFVKLA
jgi:hypothetical protein